MGGWERSREALEAHPLLKQARAVRDRHVVEMPTPLLVTLSHYAADSCRWLAAALHREWPAVPLERIVRMATIDGARALGLDGMGDIAVGQAAARHAEAR